MSSTSTANAQATPEIKTVNFSAVKCKACGFITDAASVKDVCPACGVKATMFEPLTEKFSDKRRKFLDLHIHPVADHFPQTFSIMIFVLACGHFIFTNSNLARVITDSAMLLSIVLPFSTIVSFITGIIDGRVRFKKLSSPYLRIKFVTGIAFVLLSIVNGINVLIPGFSDAPRVIVMLCISLGMVVCSSVLGKIGAELGCARMPG